MVEGQGRQRIIIEPAAAMKGSIGSTANNKQALTLIELALVILVVGIISVIAIPHFVDFRDDARDAVTRDEMQALKRAIVGDNRVVAKGSYVVPGYEADMSALPSKLGDLVTNPGATTYNPLTRSGWRGPYIDSSTNSDYSKDAWGTAYVYSSAGRYIRSCGPNGADDAGGGDDIELRF